MFKCSPPQRNSNEKEMLDKCCSSVLKKRLGFQKSNLWSLELFCAKTQIPEFTISVFQVALGWWQLWCRWNLSEFFAAGSFLPLAKCKGCENPASTSVNLCLRRLATVAWWGHLPPQPGAMGRLQTQNEETQPNPVNRTTEGGKGGTIWPTSKVTRTWLWWGPAWEGRHWGRWWCWRLWCWGRTGWRTWQTWTACLLPLVGGMGVAEDPIRRKRSWQWSNKPLSPFSNSALWLVSCSSCPLQKKLFLYFRALLFSYLNCQRQEINYLRQELFTPPTFSRILSIHFDFSLFHISLHCSIVWGT